MTPDQIRKGRGALGLDQAQFAELLGVTRTTVSGWEVGHKAPHRKSISAMELLFQYKWADLTDEELQSIIGVRANDPYWYADGLFKLARAIEAKLKEKNT
jgi:transcriptional regulator with XRE-family HTH domain